MVMQKVDIYYYSIFLTLKAIVVGMSMCVLSNELMPNRNVILILYRPAATEPIRCAIHFRFLRRSRLALPRANRRPLHNLSPIYANGHCSFLKGNSGMAFMDSGCSQDSNSVQDGSAASGPNCVWRKSQGCFELRVSEDLSLWGRCDFRHLWAMLVLWKDLYVEPTGIMKSLL